MGLEAVQDRPVPEMHAVEVPDGDGQGGRIAQRNHPATFFEHLTA
jgi:hypothetical protein